MCKKKKEEKIMNTKFITKALAAALSASMAFSMSSAVPMTAASVIGSSYDSCISSSQSSQAEHNLQNIKSGTKRLQAETGQQYAELED